MRARGTRCQRWPLCRTGGSITPRPVSPQAGTRGSGCQELAQPKHTRRAAALDQPSFGQGDAPWQHTGPPPNLPSPPSSGALCHGLKDPRYPQALPPLGHPQPSYRRWQRVSLPLGGVIPRAVCPCLATPGSGRAPLPMQRWRPCNATRVCNTGAHAMLVPMQRWRPCNVCVQRWCPCNASLPCWRPYNTGAHKMLAHTQH